MLNMNNNVNNNVVVGLIKGRHKMPVDGYIFEDAIVDVFDFAAISNTIAEFLRDSVGIKTTYTTPVNSADDTDIRCYTGKKDLVVYVTGLTCVTAELIRLCALNGVRLTLMHFNSASGEYVPQRIF